MLIYKILLPSEWDQFQATGRFDGSEFDHESGYIHCSSRTQVGATAMRVFGQEPSLMVVAVDANAIADSVRWEAASDGDLFPHIYASLPIDAVVGVHRVDGAEHVDADVPPERLQ
ncbi:MAG TPA: DUF952 domain-containing protein [Micromonosporaceae bacterium]|nr:DUF952 domain-containing protein [Micromonosporaceae bacterium]